MTIKNIILVTLLITFAALELIACSDGNSTIQSGTPNDSKTETIKQIVEQDAKATDAYMDDATITANIKAAILADIGIKTFDISVDTLEGVTTLKGQVDSTAQSEKIISMVSGIDGVKNVNNELTIDAKK